MTVDGTDFRIQEQTDDPTSWFSFKFHGPAVRYKVALGISSGDIVWTSGPYRAGRFPDLTIFCQGGLKQKLLNNKEVAVADQGYRGEPECINLPEEGSSIHQFTMKHSCDSHETCNRCLKQFGILSKRFRQDIPWHRVAFQAVVVLTQMSLENSTPLWNSNIA